MPKQTPKRTKSRSRSNVAPSRGLKASFRKLSGLQLTAVVALIVGLGIFVVWSVFAATPKNTEPETWTSSSSTGIAVKTDPTAANGSYAEFLVPTATSTVTPPTGSSVIPINAPECSGRDGNNDVPAGTWPGPKCTGIKPGTALTTINAAGDYSINSSTVVENKLIIGCVNVNANNVTIRNSKIQGCSRQTGVINNGGVVGLVIEDVEIDGQNLNPKQCGVSYGYYTARRMYVHDIGCGLNASDGTVTIEKNYLSATFGQGDPATTGSHNNGIGVNGNSSGVTGFRIYQNNILCKINGPNCSSALALYGDFSQIKDVVVENNLFNTTGVYCTYAGSVTGKAYPVAANVKYINNRFGRSISPNCGTGGPVSAWSAANGNVWSGNVWNDTGAVVTP